MITELNVLATAVLALVLQQPASLPQTGAVERPQAQADVAAVALASNAFGCQLYATLREQPGNLFLSPASIHTALAMTYAGAAGRTAEQMARTLHFALPPDRLHAAVGRLARELNHPPKFSDGDAYRLVVSNALWLQKGYPFREEFTKLVGANYDAGLNTVDYSALEPARKTINESVEHATGEKIKDLIPPGMLDPLTVLVLTNAIYFKSNWAQPFDKDTTQEGEFHLGDGSTVKAPLMHQAIYAGYMETDQFQLADLPYRGLVLSMTVLLPRQPGGLAALEKKLSAQDLAGWIAKARTMYVDVTLPRFTFTSEFELKRPLIALGMPDAFDGAQADFSPMTAAEKLWIDKVLHKAFVAVDEQGTEAAAATAVVVIRGGAPDQPQVVFRADRPFLFLIRHRPTGAILFLGRLANPQG